MTAFEGVLFDYGHTLVDIRWGEHTLIEGQRRLLAALGAPPEAWSDSMPTPVSSWTRPSAASSTTSRSTTWR